MEENKREQLIRYIQHYDGQHPWNTDRDEINLLKESVVFLLKENEEIKKIVEKFLKQD